jgi:hypothetical protein
MRGDEHDDHRALMKLFGLSSGPFLKEASLEGQVAPCQDVLGPEPGRNQTFNPSRPHPKRIDRLAPKQLRDTVSKLKTHS